MDNSEAVERLENNENLRMQRNGVNARNQENNDANTKATQAAASVAAKSGHPIAAAIGKAVKNNPELAKAIGKTTTTANKLGGLPGAMVQKATNRAAKSGAIDRLMKAKAKGNEGSNKIMPSGGVASQDGDASTTDVNGINSQTVEDNASDGSGTVNFKKDFKVLVIGMKAFVFAIPFIISVGVLYVTTHVIAKAVGLGSADRLSENQISERIDKKSDEDYRQSATEEELQTFNFYIEDNEFRDSKLSSMNLVKVAKTKYLKRKYQTVEMEELEDFFPTAINEMNNNQNLAYDFLWKLYTLYNNYREKYADKDGYGITLDLPLIMATLYEQTDDAELLFRSNLSDKDLQTFKRKSNMDEFDYDYDWSKYGYASKKDVSTHDMELLAQHMVSKDDDGTYKLDMDKYNKFLETFLYYKYYTDSGYKPYNGVAKSNDEVRNRIAKIYDLKELYEHFAGPYGEDDSVNVVDANSTNLSFWWPIGSSETTKDSSGRTYAKGTPVPTVITSYFGSTEAGIHDNGHGALDISGSYEIGEVNIIAARSGVVVDVDDGFNSIGYYGCKDGGGYGNHVIIQHPDGTATTYGHMAKDTVTVKLGEQVSQGQVIGKMGSSGSSTGLHLHFEVRVAPGTYDNRVDPLEYVDMDNPRPITGGGGSFPLYTTTLSKTEFVTKMNEYCNNKGNQAFCNNFAKNAEKIYDVSVENNVNPELVVVTAGTESSWQGCGYTNNYWGIKVPNGVSCLDGPSYRTIYEGIKDYAKLISEFQTNQQYVSEITARNEERENAGCSPAGHGLPGTLEGMQSRYSWVGNYRYNPGDSGLGGCYVLNYVYNQGYCNTHPSCSDYSNCPAQSATTVCEQNDYTAWQLKGKRDIRYDIFGL